MRRTETPEAPATAASDAPAGRPPRLVRKSEVEASPSASEPAAAPETPPGRPPRLLRQIDMNETIVSPPPVAAQEPPAVEPSDVSSEPAGSSRRDSRGRFLPAAAKRTRIKPEGAQ